MKTQYSNSTIAGRNCPAILFLKKLHTHQSNILFMNSFYPILKSLLLSVFILIVLQLEAQTTVTFNYTGAAVNWTVPPCVTTINVTAAGGKGGGGASGGMGAIVTGTIAVTPGQVLQIRVGGQGGCPTAGWNGGAAGGAQGNYPGQLLACGGGGGTDLRIAPYGLGNRVIVGGGGGGMAGGDSWTAPTVIGGNGGCPNGAWGTSSFGQGGGGGTTVAGGAGGAGWGSGNAGLPGGLAVGGQGGNDNMVIYAAGGGGGGGLYGGGGGGADGCCIGANGGGAGGGGSSLIPGGGGCNTNNNGNGYLTITYSGTPPVAGTVTATPNPICAGQTTTLTVTGSSGAIQWQVSTNGVELGIILLELQIQLIQHPLFLQILATE